MEEKFSVKGTSTPASPASFAESRPADRPGKNSQNPVLNSQLQTQANQNPPQQTINPPQPQAVVSQNTSQSTENKPPGNVADKINKEFQVNLPGKGLETPIRLIAFFTLVGGLSIIGGLFTDIIKPSNEDYLLYVLRIILGVTAIAISYGIVERRSWSIWLYGFLTFIAIISNPFLSFLPAAVAVHLFLKRRIFYPSLPDFILAKALLFLKGIINKTPPLAG